MPDAPLPVQAQRPGLQRPPSNPIPKPPSPAGRRSPLHWLGLAALAFFYLGTYERPPVDPDWAVMASADIPPGSVTVRYTGTATLVFSDGETTWMTDGWFSRPGPLALFLGEIEPDLDAISQGLVDNGVDRLAAVFPVPLDQSHGHVESLAHKRPAVP